LSGDSETFYPGAEMPTFAGGDMPTVAGGGLATSFDPGSEVTGFTPPPDTPAFPPGDAEPTMAGPGGGSGVPFERQLAPGQNFGARYHIIRMLGVGGMGAVYHAWDGELGVAVALKVVRPEVAADPHSARELDQRFKRELLLARQVTHKNVVRIHDLGEINGIKYITMPYVNGEDLATRLKREGKIPVPQALRIMRGVVAGLVAAHDAGVVHRDLKPANIMIEAPSEAVDGVEVPPDGEALIMDFGIARSAAGPAGRAVAGGLVPAALLNAPAVSLAGETVAGAIVGTIEYMAPEQARGQPADQRADVYSLGLILYDMLTGRRRAEHAQSAIAELQARMADPPPPVRSLAPDVPEALERLISRCLEPDAAARFQNSVELAADLARLDDDGIPLPEVRRLTTRMLVAAAALMAALVTGTWWFSRGPAAPVQLEPVPILIADFENLTNDPVFEGTLERTLSIALEEAPFITAFDRPQARRIAAAQIGPGARLDGKAAQLIAVREGIKVVLAGSIEPRGSGYAIAVRGLRGDVNAEASTGQADAAPAAELWTHSATARSKDQVLRALGTVASDIRSALGDTASASERLASAETITAGSLEAVREYSMAQDLHSAGKFEEAAGYYERAIALDDEFGRAYAGWATTLYHLRRRDEAEERWKQALALMDRMTEREKYRTLGTYALAIAQNYEMAIDNYTKLVERYPTDLAGHNNLGFAYFNVLNFPKALEEGRKALELYPKNVLFRNNYALYAMYASDFETAAKEAEALVADAPGFSKNYLPLAVAAMANGNYDAARQAYARMAATGPEGAATANMGLADLAIYTGRFAEAEKLLREGIAADEKSGNGALGAAKHVALAALYQASNRSALAVREIDTALTQGGRDPAVLVPAARVHLLAGRKDEAAAIAATLDNQLQPQPRAYAKIIDANIALLNTRRASAVDDFREAIKLADFWIARFDLGVTYAAAGHYAEALNELEICLRRRGEATALFLDDTPTFRYLATLPYWLGRAQEGVGQTAAALTNYKAFLALRADAPDDPLVKDARSRIN
jgi:serine/threonine protein kinase/tetratricopeptide (TPR) repeat protein